MGRPASRLRCTIYVLVTGMFLSGCVIPVPYPSGYYGPRRNVGYAVPDFIVSGKTTREEVLLALGQADGRALDESWLSFGVVYRKGGVVIATYPPVGPDFDSYETRRLVVFFDELGVVESAQVESKACDEVRWPILKEPRFSTPCIDAAGGDLPAYRSLQPAH